MKTIIKIRGLTKSFKEAPIIENFDLDIYEDEILVIMGPSGIGKSTLLNIIGQIDKAYDGQIQYASDIFDNIPVPLPFVFQESETLLPWKTVEENIKLVQRKPDEEVILKILAELELLEHRNKYPHELSGGMKQRVGIARALVCRSKILLMDEPFGSLDLTLRNKLQDLILKIKEENHLTILFVTHDEDEAMRIGNRVIRLNREWQNNKAHASL